MIVPAYIRRAFAGWMAWRARQRLYRAVPVLMELDQLQGALARQHRPGVRAIERQKRAVMTARLRLEVRP